MIINQFTIKIPSPPPPPTTKTLRTEDPAGLRYAVFFNGNVVVATFCSTYWAKRLVANSAASLEFKIIDLKTGEVIQD